MSDSSYARAVPFPSGFSSVQAPFHMAYAASLAGCVPPDTSEGGVYCDLGCGDGTSLTLLAAANPGWDFVGVDFNPRHVALANATASRTGLNNVRFVESAFDALDAANLPRCDFVAMRGVYCWLSADQSLAARRLAAEILRPDGLFSVDTLLLPSRAAAPPLWHTMRQLVSGTTVPEARLPAVLEWIDVLERLGARYPRATTWLGPRLAETLRACAVSPQKRSWVVHHGLGDQGRALTFGDLASEMAAVGLSFCAHASLAENLLELRLPAGLLDRIEALDDPTLRQRAVDFVTCAHDRGSVFARRPVAGSGEFARTRVYLLYRPGPAHWPQGRTLHVALPGGGRFPLDDALHTAVAEQLVDRARTAQEVCEALDGWPGPQVERAFHRLAATGQYFILQRPIASDREGATGRRWRMPLAINRDQLQGLWAGRKLRLFFADEHSGGSQMSLNPIQAAMLDGLLEDHEGHRLLEHARARLAGLEGLALRGGTRPADLPDEGLVLALQRFRRGPLNNLLRLGIVERCP